MLISPLSEFVRSNPGLVVLTGAGCSIAAGIPAYRDEKGHWQRNDPITHQQFTGNLTYRQRYWARSFHGWPAIAGASPTAAHRAIAALAKAGYVSTIVTQNVDNLHQQAQTPCPVVDLHGNLQRVTCLDCGNCVSRHDLQDALKLLNPMAPGEQLLAPDGDADIDDERIRGFRYPDCSCCGGVLKPDVVFFGGSVPKQLVSDLRETIARASGLLVIGSSLKVFSGYRFCRWAAADGVPVVSVNPGSTRADDLLTLAVRADCQQAITTCTSVLGLDHE